MKMSNESSNVSYTSNGNNTIINWENVSVTVELLTPIAMDKGLKFAIREGGKTVGAGVVAEIIE